MAEVLTQGGSTAILEGSNSSLPSASSGVPPDSPYLTHLKSDRDRDIGEIRGLLAQVSAKEKRWGLDQARMCRHCGKPYNRGEAG